MNNIPELGVGVTFFSGLEQTIRKNFDLINFLEIEPQTVWKQKELDTNEYIIDEQTITDINSFDVPKLLHSVGLPVGGTHLPDLGQIHLLKKMIEQMRSPWVSEHLSFNEVDNEKNFFTGFLLPPRQTMEGVKSYVKTIRYLKNKVRVPLAIEVGVNYLRPRADELSDGEFISRIANNADCGILLDLHNVWANSVNGRQPIHDFLKQIPLKRVWEIHVAGGFEHEGYWLDAHSGEIPEKLFDIAKNVVPKLTNLSAIVFELFSSYFSQFGDEQIHSQLKLLHQLWSLRNRQHLESKITHMKNVQNKPIVKHSPKEWEVTLGSLVTYQHTKGQLSKELSDDPAIELYRKLIYSFRASMIIRTLKISVRMLTLTLGKYEFNRLLEKYSTERAPKAFASSEAKQFVDYIKAEKKNIPYLEDIMRYEIAVISTLLDSKTRIVNFNYEPLPVLMAISENKFPKPAKNGKFEIEIVPDLNVSNENYGEESWQAMRWHH